MKREIQHRISHSHIKIHTKTFHQQLLRWLKKEKALIRDQAQTTIGSGG